MESPTLQELIEQHGLSEGDCNQLATDVHLEQISRVCCRQWKSLPAHLGLETVVAEDIDKGQKGEREKRHDFLRQWKEIKGSAATYKRLLTALMEIRCTQDAGKVCEVLRGEVSTPPQQSAASQPLNTAPALAPPGTTSTDISSTQSQSCSIASLNSDTLEDLNRQLSSELHSIMTKYSHYVRRIRLSLRDKGLTARELCSDLLSMSATDHAEQGPSLLSAHKDELRKATDLNDIFDFLVTEFASFLNYDIFQFMIDTYRIDHGQEELKYPKYLNAYLQKHRVSEFLEINPLLKKHTAASTELILKIDIESTSRLAKLTKLKTAIAKILDLKSASLRLLDIKDGCIVVTFLLPTPVAEFLFNKHTVLTKQQEKQIQILPILRMECNGCVLVDKIPAKHTDYKDSTGWNKDKPTATIEMEEAHVQMKDDKEITSFSSPGQGLPTFLDYTSANQPAPLKSEWKEGTLDQHPFYTSFELDLHPTREEVHSTCTPSERVKREHTQPAPLLHEECTRPAPLQRGGALNLNSSRASGKGRTYRPALFQREWKAPIPLHRYPSHPLERVKRPAPLHSEWKGGAYDLRSSRRHVGPINKARKVVGEIVQKLLKSEILKVAEVFIGGSVGQGTAVAHHYDLDLVLYSHSITYKEALRDGYYDDIKRNIKVYLARELSPNYTYLGETGVAIKFKYTLPEQGYLDVDLLLSPYWKSIEDYWRDLAEINPPAMRYKLFLGASKYQTMFIKQQPPMVCELIRRTKAWRHVEWEDSDVGKPKSYLLSLLVITAYDRVNNKNTKFTHLAQEVGKKLTEIVKEITSDDKLDLRIPGTSDSVATSALLPPCPRIIDPVNPANNLYWSGVGPNQYGYPVEGKWWAFQEKAHKIDISITEERIIKRA